MKAKKSPRSQKPMRKPSRSELEAALEESARVTRVESKMRRAAERERDEWRSKADELLRWADAVRKEFIDAGFPDGDRSVLLGHLRTAIADADACRAGATKEHQAKANEWGKREEAERERDEARERVQELELALREVLANCGCEAGGGARSPCSNCLRVEAALASAPRGPREQVLAERAGLMRRLAEDDARGPREPPPCFTPEQEAIIRQCETFDGESGE